MSSIGILGREAAHLCVQAIYSIQHQKNLKINSRIKDHQEWMNNRWWMKIFKRKKVTFEDAHQHMKADQWNWNLSHITWKYDEKIKKIKPILDVSKSKPDSIIRIDVKIYNLIQNYSNKEIVTQNIFR